MAAPEHRHLRVVDLETGEAFEDCPNCAELQVQLDGATSEIRGWRAKFGKLRADKDAEARADDRWDEVAGLFELWRIAAGPAGIPKRSKFAPDRFRLALPYVKQDGHERCCQAIIGRCYDHFSSKRANGSLKRFCEWERIFGNRGDFEESANRVPLTDEATWFRDSGEAIGDWLARMDLWAPVADWAAGLRYPRLV
jgi:hypothetical protein